MARKKHLINVHTSTGTTAPTGASLYLGEIAVQHTPNDPALWVKMGTSESSTEYEKFIGLTEITNIFNDSKILGSGYTYSGLPFVNSATTIADAYSALTNEVLDNELVTAAALNDINNRIGGVLTINANGETVGEYSPSADTEINLEIVSDKTLGSGYTYSGLPFVNSATQISDAYSALTKEVLDNELVTAAALNDLNSRITELSASTGDNTEIIEYIQENEEVVAGALNNLNNRVSVVETHMTGDYIPITGYIVASGITEEELTLKETDTVNEALGKLQKQSLDNEEAIAAGLNDLNERVTANTAAIAKNTGVTVLSGVVRSLQNEVYNFEDDYSYYTGTTIQYGLSAATVALSSATQSLSAVVQSISAKTSGILTINANGVEQGRYSPSANTTIDLQIVSDVTGADVLLTGYELATGTTEEELAIVATDTVNEAFGKIQKQNYDNEAVVAGALNDLDERILALEAGGGTEEIWDEIEDQELIVAAALNDLNERIIDLSGDSSYQSSLIQVLSGLVADISGNTGGGGGEQAVTAVTVTGTGNAVTNATFSNKALTLTKGNVLTSADTRSVFVAISGVTTYAEITQAANDGKVIIGKLAENNPNVYIYAGHFYGSGSLKGHAFNCISYGGTSVAVKAMACNASSVWTSGDEFLWGDYETVTAITSSSDDNHVPTAGAVYNAIPKSGTTTTTYARGDQFLAVSAATTGNTSNLNTLSGAAHNKITNLSGATTAISTNLTTLSGAAHTKITNLSAATTAHTATTIANGTSSQMHLPTVSASENGKILRVVNGAWALVDPPTITYSSSQPSGGKDGDVWIQTS